MTTSRRSALSGMRPTAPHPQEEAEDQPRRDAGPESAGPAGQEVSSDSAAASTRQDESAQPARAKKPPKKPQKSKLTFYIKDEEMERAKAAYKHTMGHTEIPSWTQFLEAAVREFTHRLEEQYNDSRPFNT